MSLFYSKSAAKAIKSSTESHSSRAPYGVPVNRLKRPQKHHMDFELLHLLSECSGETKPSNSHLSRNSKPMVWPDPDIHDMGYREAAALRTASTPLPNTCYLLNTTTAHPPASTITPF